ncbi:MAG: class I SAM-dependent methyltransferase [bacterium]|nr:class I SAM-dependent methyltransferase [bacterium]
MSKLLICESANDEYCDGPVEDELLALVSGPETISFEALARGDISWPLRYHVDPRRKQLLSWYSFSSSDSMLEVGGGCGALTGFFCDKFAHVTSVELSPKRARIIHERHKERSNLAVIASDILSFSSETTFDCISCIGVLEYAGKFSSTAADPHVNFLSHLNSLLSRDGMLILAIENRFGLKYWSGAPEDHTGINFDSIQGYCAAGVQTFGKKELIGILNTSGFQSVFFYYPLPDYKFPEEIFSDYYLPSNKHHVRSDIFPFYRQGGVQLFDEKKTLSYIIENGNFDFFANSFLVFCKKEV